MLRLLEVLYAKKMCQKSNPIWVKHAQMAALYPPTCTVNADVCAL